MRAASLLVVLLLGAVGIARANEEPSEARLLQEAACCIHCHKRTQFLYADLILAPSRLPKILLTLCSSAPRTLKQTQERKQRRI